MSDVYEIQTDGQSQQQEAFPLVHSFRVGRLRVSRAAGEVDIPQKATKLEWSRDGAPTSVPSLRVIRTSARTSGEGPGSREMHAQMRSGVAGLRYVSPQLGMLMRSDRVAASGVQIASETSAPCGVISFFSSVPWLHGRALEKKRMDRVQECQVLVSTRDMQYESGLARESRADL